MNTALFFKKQAKRKIFIWRKYAKEERLRKINGSIGVVYVTCEIMKTGISFCPHSIFFLYNQLYLPQKVGEI